MSTITDIEFDHNLFSANDHWLTILYQLCDEGPSIYIPLNHLDLLTFIKTFDDIYHCQTVIQENNHRRFTLFAYSENLETWLWNNNPIPDNLEDIILFCPFKDDIQYLQDWTKQYTKKIQIIISYQSLERQLLLNGIDYILNLIPKYENYQDILERLNQMYLRMTLALTVLFQNADD